MGLNPFPIVLGAILFAFSSIHAEDWTTDYSAALAAASQRDRAVFLFFTGSDWCGYCQALDREVLSTPEFAAFAEQNLILVKIDFPRRTTLPADQAAQNQSLAKKFGIQGFPTVFIVNHQGQVAGRLGYSPGGPADFIGQIRQIAGFTWRGSSPAASAGGGNAGSAKPSTDAPPAPPFNGAQLHPPKRFDRLQLNGIMGTKQRPLVIINNQTLTVGESTRLDLNGARVKVTCKE